MTRAYLGLGANVGDLVENLRQAAKSLVSPDLMLCRSSQLYKTEPIGLREQPWFLNLVLEVETNFGATDLLHHCQAVEHKLGRQRLVKNGPRTIDIDILLYGQTVMSTEELTIPHPRYQDRRFTLMPLAELSPELRDPVSGESMSGLLQKLKDDSACYPAGTSL